MTAASRMSTMVKAVTCLERKVTVQLLAETAMALRHTLGTGSEDDNRTLDRLERTVWLELVHACRDRREREYLIEQARATVAPPGAVSCRHAARLLVRLGGLLLHTAAQLPTRERDQARRIARECGAGAVRLERIALETGGL